MRLEVATNDDGYYRFPLLPVGLDTLTVVKAGFREYRRNGITLNVGRQIRLVIYTPEVI